MVDQNDQLIFEQPLNERARTFLRLEYLFSQAMHHAGDDSYWGRHATMIATLDTLSMFSRSDLRTEVLKELGNQYKKLDKLSNRKGVDQAELDKVLNQLKPVIDEIDQIPPQFAVGIIRNNDFLTGILNRSSIPGGCCGFDLPGYHRWLMNTPDQLKKDLDLWHKSLKPFQQAIYLTIGLIRDSAVPEQHTAKEGMYIHVMESPCQIVRVIMDRPGGYYPEISAGKHRCTIRFMDQTDISKRAEQTEQDINFRLALCAI